MDQVVQVVALLGAVALLPLGAACGGAEEEVPSIDYTTMPYASAVVSFTPGEGAGYGESRLPDVVLGPPDGKGRMAGSLDVLSLGVGGEIVLGFPHRPLYDVSGPDFVVFENAFFANGDPSMPFFELGEVSVSENGTDWETFPCDVNGTAGAYEGCAGWHPTEKYFFDQLDPILPELVGGDQFDLAELGVTRALYVRIKDLSGEGEAPTAGFDLDAIGVVAAPPR